MKKLNQKGFGAIEGLLILIIVGLISFVGWYVWRQNTTKETKSNTDSATPSNTVNSATIKSTAQSKTLLKGDFGNNNSDYGTLQVEGYATTEKRVDEPGDVTLCQSNCKQDSYVFFNIMRTENANIFTYLQSNKGNSYVQDEAIGMGCLADGQISYLNVSDAKGSPQYMIPKDDTTKIMAATTAKPIILQLERLKLTGGGGAPTCYSHFTTFKVL